MTTEIEWISLQKVLTEAADYLTITAKSYLPDNYEIRENIKFVLGVGSRQFEIDFSAPDYWKYINDGRRPGKQPPTEEITKWIKKREITPLPAKNGSVPTVESLSYLIARKIGKKGIKGNRFYDLTIDEFKKEFDQRIADAVTEDLSRHIDKILSPLTGME